MLAVAPLMIEHRLIEKMIRLVDQKRQAALQSGRLDVLFVDRAVDFIRTYADRCHHGKEEDILFRDLAKKRISGEHKRILDELVQEHIYGRQTTGKLVAARDRYAGGEATALAEAAGYMKELAAFYPAHIAKEDKGFFIPCMKYFSHDEQTHMLSEFWEFDRQLIHEKYGDVVRQFEKAQQVPPGA